MGAKCIERALGREGVVYLSVPAHNEGCGKIHLTLQNRTIEIDAVTSGQRLATGSSVVVTSVLWPPSASQ